MASSSAGGSSRSVAAWSSPAPACRRASTATTRGRAPTSSSVWTTSESRSPAHASWGPRPFRSRSTKTTRRLPGSGASSVVATTRGSGFGLHEPAGGEPRSDQRREPTPGELTFFEVGVADVPRGRAFYGGLFGWEFERVGGGLVIAGAGPGGGIHGGDEGASPYVFFAVEDMDVAVARVRGLGGAADPSAAGATTTAPSSATGASCSAATTRARASASTSRPPADRPRPRERAAVGRLGREPMLAGPMSIDRAGA